MNKLINIFLFLFGLALTLFSLLLFVVFIVIEMEGFEDENSKIGAYVISFLMSPVAACGIRLMVKYRPQRHKKRIKMAKILKIIQGKESCLTTMDFVSKLNLSMNEADLALKELEKIGFGKLSNDRFGQIELCIDKPNFFYKINQEINFKNSIQRFYKATDMFRFALRIIASIIFIGFSMVMIFFRIPHCCGDGFYYLIFFSLLGGLSSTYLIWSYRREKKKVFPKFIEIRS